VSEIVSAGVDGFGQELRALTCRGAHARLLQWSG
jgi:hypothetical protein